MTGIPVEGLDCKKVPPKHPSCDDHPRGSRALGTRKAGRDEGEEAPHLYIYKLPINRFSGRYVSEYVDNFIGFSQKKFRWESNKL